MTSIRNGAQFRSFQMSLLSASWSLDGSGAGFLRGSNPLARSSDWAVSRPIPWRKERRAVVSAGLVAEPVVSLVRTTAFYALFHVGAAGRSPADEKTGWAPLVHGFLFGSTKKKQQKKAASSLRSKWHTSTKGTLVRKYRVPTMRQGRKLLSSISSLLSSDDLFTDAGTHKGCLIRRENAHAESLCCNNVRALLDEQPTPHLVVEITVFPAGPVTESHYEKAEKIEKVLRTEASI